MDDLLALFDECPPGEEGKDSNSNNNHGDDNNNIDEDDDAQVEALLAQGRPNNNNNNNNSDPEESHLGIRITQRSVSSADVRDLLSDYLANQTLAAPAQLAAMAWKQLNALLLDPTPVLSAATVCGPTRLLTIGTLFECSPSKLTKNGQAYCRLTVGRLPSGPAAAVLVFGAAYRRVMTAGKVGNGNQNNNNGKAAASSFQPGSVVALVHPRLLPGNNNNNKPNDLNITLSINDESQLRLLGVDRDYGVCGAAQTQFRKNEHGKYVPTGTTTRCRCFVDKRLGPRCAKHKGQSQNSNSKGPTLASLARGNSAKSSQQQTSSKLQALRQEPTYFPKHAHPQQQQQQQQRLQQTQHPQRRLGMPTKGPMASTSTTPLLQSTAPSASDRKFAQYCQNFNLSTMPVITPPHQNHKNKNNGNHKSSSSLQRQQQQQRQVTHNPYAASNRNKTASSSASFPKNNTTINNNKNMKKKNATTTTARTEKTRSVVVHDLLQAHNSKKQTKASSSSSILSRQSTGKPTGSHLSTATNRQQQKAGQKRSMPQQHTPLLSSTGNNNNNNNNSSKKNKRPRSVNTTTLSGFDGSVCVPAPSRLFARAGTANHACATNAAASIVGHEQPDPHDQALHARILERQQQMAEKRHEQAGQSGTRTLTKAGDEKKKTNSNNNSSASDSLFGKLNQKDLERAATAKSRFQNEIDAENYVQHRRTMAELEQQESRKNGGNKNKNKPGHVNNNKIQTAWFCQTCARSFTGRAPLACQRQGHTLQRQRSIARQGSLSEARQQLSDKGGLTLGAGLEWSRQFAGSRFS